MSGRSDFPNLPRWLAPRLPRWVIGVIMLDGALTAGLSFAGNSKAVIVLVGLTRFIVFIAVVFWLIVRFSAFRHGGDPESATVRDNEPPPPSAADAARQRLWKP